MKRPSKIESEGKEISKWQKFKKNGGFWSFRDPKMLMLLEEDEEDE